MRWERIVGRRVSSVGHGMVYPPTFRGLAAFPPMQRRSLLHVSFVRKHISVIRKTVDKVCRKANDDAKERVDSFKESIGEEEDERTAKKLVKRYLREQSHISAVNALFNPRSFTQTVENVFHFSFLVKEGAASIHARGTDVAAKYDAEPGPVLCKANAPSPETGANKQNTQAVIRLNMRVRNCAPISV